MKDLSTPQDRLRQAAASLRLQAEMAQVVHDHFNPLYEACWARTETGGLGKLLMPETALLLRFYTFDQKRDAERLLVEAADAEAGAEAIEQLQRKGKFDRVFAPETAPDDGSYSTMKEWLGDEREAMDDIRGGAGDEIEYDTETDTFRFAMGSGVAPMLEIPNPCDPDNLIEGAIRVAKMADIYWNGVV